MRVVLDTNVVASAILWGGTPHVLLQAAREKRMELFTSMPMLAELTDIIGRPNVARKIAASKLSALLGPKPVNTLIVFFHAAR